MNVPHLDIVLVNFPVQLGVLATLIFIISGAIPFKYWLAIKLIVLYTVVYKIAINIKSHGLNKVTIITICNYVTLITHVSNQVFSLSLSSSSTLNAFSSHDLILIARHLITNANNCMAAVGIYHLPFCCYAERRFVVRLFNCDKNICWNQDRIEKLYLVNNYRCWDQTTTKTTTTTTVLCIGNPGKNNKLHKERSVRNWQH